MRNHGGKRSAIGGLAFFLLASSPGWLAKGFRPPHAAGHRVHAAGGEIAGEPREETPAKFSRAARRRDWELGRGGRILLPAMSAATARSASGALGPARLAAVAAAPTLQLAYFYKPPLDQTTPAWLAHNERLIILTHADEPYMARLRRAGYRGPILQNLAANEAEGPGPYANAHAACDRRFQPFQRTPVDQPGAFCGEVQGHERWFLHNRRGVRLYSRYRSADGVWRTVYAMNPGSRGWQRFVARRVAEYQRFGFSGLFLDNVALSRDGLLHQTSDRGGVAEYRTSAAYRRATVAYLRALRRRFPHLTIWANLVHDRYRRPDWGAYLPELDGIMVEDFAVGWPSYALSPKRAAVQMDDIRQALKAGKSVLAVAQGHRWQRQRLRRALAAYWLLDNGRLYFRYADAGDEDYRTVWRYRLYAWSPGRPIGWLRQRGNLWWRRFQRATISLNVDTGVVSGIGAATAPHAAGQRVHAAGGEIACGPREEAPAKFRLAARWRGCR